MADVVEVKPDDLSFRFQLNKQMLATITINNPYDRRLAFKVKTTAPKKYVVRPSSGVAEPRSSVSIQVIMQAQKDYPADFQNCKDKFMVQTTVLADEEQIDNSTFLKESRKDLTEARLRVILDGPAAPPSPVQEDETEEEGFRASEPAYVAAGGDRLKTTLNDLSAVSVENSSLKSQLERVFKERDDLRKRLDFIELQGGGGKATGSSTAQDTSAKLRITMLHIILVAIIAFIIGHFT